MIEREDAGEPVIAVTQQRPIWPYAIPEDFARWVYTHSVDSITVNGVWHSEDSWSNHLLLHSEKDSRRLPPGIDFKSPYLVWYTNRASIVSLADHVASTIDTIDKWKKTNSRELAEYKRLHAKYKGLQI